MIRDKVEEVEEVEEDKVDGVKVKDKLKEEDYYEFEDKREDLFYVGVICAGTLCVLIPIIRRIVQSEPLRNYEMIQLVTLAFTWVVFVKSIQNYPSSLQIQGNGSNTDGFVGKIFAT